ncbi:MAG: hypothetical protein AB1640_15985 [bacterium]
MGKKGSTPEEEERFADSTSVRRLDFWVPEVVKRALLIGAGTLFLTEEGIRKTLSEFNLPKDVVSYLAKQSEKSGTELISAVQRELRRFLSHVDITGMTRDILDGVSLEIHTKVTLRTKKEQASAGQEEGTETARRNKDRSKK